MCHCFVVSMDVKAYRLNRRSRPAVGCVTEPCFSRFPRRRETNVGHSRCECGFCYYCFRGFPSQRSACFGCWFVSESSHVLKLADRKSRLANSHRTSRTVKTAHIPSVKKPPSKSDTFKLICALLHDDVYQLRGTAEEVWDVTSNTRYYWNQILSELLACCSVMMYSSYMSVRNEVSDVVNLVT